MKNFINDIKNFFERKSNNSNDKVTQVVTKVIKKDNGIVKERVKFYEDPATFNAERPRSDRPDTRYSKRKASCDVFKSADESNIDSTPSMVVNDDNICIYQSMDAIYGSFKIRQQTVANGEYEENDVVIRLKVRETEHLGVRRYESIFKAPLSQQVIASKYRDCPENTIPKSHDGDSQANVTSMIDKWNQQCISNKQQEGLIDFELLKSIRKKRSSISSGETYVNMLQLLESNQSLSWADTERVRSTDLLDRLTREEIFFQESQFELISSEASYYRSLNVLIDKFYHSPLLSVKNKDSDAICVIKAHQKEHLFSNILQIHSISGRFLADLEKRFTESVVMKDVCDIVIEYASGAFNVYVPYIQNQKFQTDAYNELKKNEEASKVIERLEAQPECCSLSLDSFLMLPMQRLLRILLLLKSIKKNVPECFTASSESADRAITAVESVIMQCSAKKDHMDERERMLQISTSLSFKPGQPPFPISSGKLLHEGEVKCQRKNTRFRTYMSSLRKTAFTAWLILTDEYLLITKVIKNKELTYLVEDWCKISEMSVEGILTEDNNHREFHVNFRSSITYSLQPKTKNECVRWLNELSSSFETRTSNDPVED